MEDNIFGKRLRELRLEKNLTQVQLAELLHFTQSNISAWERGKEANYDYLIAIAKFFDVTIDYLLGLAEI